MARKPTPAAGRVPFWHMKTSWDTPTPSLPFYVGTRILTDAGKGISTFEGPHIHSGVELAVCLEGGGELYLDGRRFPLDAGDCLLVDATVPHCAASGTKKEFNYLYVHIAVDALLSVQPPGTGLELLQMFRRSRGGSVSGVRGRRDVADLFRTADNVFRGSGKYDKARSWAYVTGALLEIVQIAFPDGIQGEKRLEASARQPVLDAVNYIHKNFARPISLEEISVACSLSSSSLSHLFAKALDYSPIEYRNKLRIDAAIRRIQGSDDKIEAIAEEAGFESMPHFYRAFRKFTGTTPQALRS